MEGEIVVLLGGGEEGEALRERAPGGEMKEGRPRHKGQVIRGERASGDREPLHRWIRRARTGRVKMSSYGKET